MSVDELKAFGFDTNRYSDSKVKRFRLILRLLEQNGISEFNTIKGFIRDIDAKTRNEEISNVLNERFGTSYAHTTSRDLFNCLKSITEEYEKSNTKNVNSKDLHPAQKAPDLGQVFILAEELKKNYNNSNMDDELKGDINKLILQKLNEVISNLL
tara:strand:+ start:431 stop:895 length:465 start_codon:yes stop_codon:yes gene_type:complete